MPTLACTCTALPLPLYREMVGKVMRVQHSFQRGIVPAVILMATFMSLNGSLAGSFSSVEVAAAAALPEGGSDGVTRRSDQLHHYIPAVPWENWSSDTTVQGSASNPSYAGSVPLGFTITAAYGGLNLHNSTGIDTVGYDSLQFYLDGGASSGQELTVHINDATGQVTANALSIDRYIDGGAILAGERRRVRVPLADLGGMKRVITGFILQDAAGHAQPTVYLDDLRLVVSAPNPPTVAQAIAGPQPFSNVPRHPNQYYEAKVALQWLPQVKRAVEDAQNAGLLNQGEVPLFENILLGVVAIEGVGQAFIVPDSPSGEQGLTQLTGANSYAEENPFDPLTNLHNYLRVVIRYYRQWGNRWDRAVTQHLTGLETEADQRYSPVSKGTIGEVYVQELVNAVWQAAQLQRTGDLFPRHDDRLQAGCGGGTCYYDHAPPWGIWDSPALAYTWVPPASNGQAYQYFQNGMDRNIDQPIDKYIWLAVPSWFYTSSPAPDVAVYAPRSPTELEEATNPYGYTLNNRSVAAGTYPRRTWFPSKR